MATRCLESSKLTRPAIVPDESVRILTDNIDSFFVFLDTKEEWQRPLLEHLECKSTEARLHEFLSSGVSIKFTLASDGGARDDLGSYEWEIAIDCEILWQCKVPTFGLQPGSSRAESYGFFSALLFLKANTEYYSITINIDTLHDFLCDSKSLLKPIQRTITRSSTNPSHCLASDYNLESGIVDIISALGIVHSTIYMLKVTRMTLQMCTFYHGPLR